MAQSAPVVDGTPTSDDAASTATGHLPIGEVLALLKEEFPDVTISKIRFLESQGLIQPERTASGYRRFSSDDIDRLQWILRQQRDNFLPLKVIRRMLDEGVDRYDPGGGVQPTLFTSSAAEQLGDDMDPEQDAVDSQDTVRRSPAHPAVASAPPGRAVEPPGSVGGRSQADRVTSRPAERAPVPGGATAAPVTSAASPPTADETVRAQQRQGPAERPDSAAEDPVEKTERRPHSTPADVVAALQEDPRKPARASDSAAAPIEGAAEPRTAARRRARPDPAPADTLVDAEELCRSSGIDAALLVDLERFGLLRTEDDSGEYGPLALEVARMAARYRELGVEPRHLRMYLVAAEREAGMVEQLAVPLLKQRNPDARGHAAELASELVELGADLHRSLLRRELGRDLMP